MAVDEEEDDDDDDEEEKTESGGRLGGRPPPPLLLNEPVRFKLWMRSVRGRSSEDESQFPTFTGAITSHVPGAVPAQMWASATPDSGSEGATASAVTVDSDDWKSAS